MIFAVGDVHGRADLLERVFRRIDVDRARTGAEGFSAADTYEVYLGDYVDRGPTSANVLDLLIARQRVRPFGVICLKGNHEALFEDFLAGRLALQEWRKMGGLETLLSYGVDPRRAASTGEEDLRNELAARVPSLHRVFLASLHASFALGHYLFVHAGIRPNVDLAHQTPGDLLWIRNEFLDYAESFGRIVVHGHSPTERPDFRSNRINIDTGAYATDRLTCIRIGPAGVCLLEDN